MHHFNSKSLTFYATAIGSVLVLFQSITFYGEKHLQASPVIDGVYRLTFTDNVPECRRSQPLTLDIQQSGIYINASLLPATTNKPIQKQYSLKGILNHQQLNLTGEVYHTNLCNIAPPHTLQAQMRLTEGKKLQGKIIISTIAQNLEFNATPEAAQAETKNSNSH
ncbi:hypothetical protein CLI64_29130 [Nostoc sp. CENA543]|uniref:hypothetical protein n=1 Tax=Nostoc sp. CENA543 TaxID=1869241 RepID=UPI000CA0FD96|nr:hypothetical protein [Nostoc sp. CENA543]AUT04121.1 hypothetical protein CLI64_29130 [Nostoc sp. CENA543]